jgi:hypothetical protein
MCVSQTLQTRACRGVLWVAEKVAVRQIGIAAAYLCATCLVGSCDYNDFNGHSKVFAGQFVSSNPPGPLRIYRSPYREVDWSTDLRLQAQHHDHIGSSVNRLAAYDKAGYDVVALMDYSGAPSLPQARTSRLWPPESVFSSNVLAGLQNIDLLIPGAEEVGISSRHFTSPFLTEYIEYSDGSNSAGSTNQYSNEHQLAALIRAKSGLPLIAHPWYAPEELISGPEVFGMEVYSAYIAAKRQLGDPLFLSERTNEGLVERWDRVLSTGRWWIGIAVNDHFGPYSLPVTVDDRVRDSGKIVVLSKAATVDAYRNAFERGALFAVRDDGVVKGAYPRIDSISVGEQSVSITAQNATRIRWLSMGQWVGEGETLPYTSLPSGAVYARAEVQGASQTVVFVQPFVLRHVDDTNGDGLVDAADESVCRAVQAGDENDPDVVAACAARL